jgi:hypothetical protein
VFTLAHREVLIQFLVQPLTSRDLERSAISHKLHDIPRSLQNRAAMRTVLKVGGHDGTETGIYFIVKIVGDLPPYFFAVNFDWLLRQALPPFPTSIQVRRQACDA